MRVEQMEQLENRRLYTATVVETYPGYWEITGDDTDEALVVTVNGMDRTFLFEGITYGDGALEHVAVFGRGGNDRIMVTTTGDPGNVGATINAGDGDDSVFLNFTGAVYGGRGNDRIELWDAGYGEAYGEDGDDVIIIGGETYSAEVRGGAGNDVIDARQCNYSNVLRGGAGNDILYASNNGDMLFGDDGADTLLGGAGDDEFHTGETVQGGGGYDIVYGNYMGGSYTGIAEFVYT